MLYYSLPPKKIGMQKCLVELRVFGKCYVGEVYGI